MMPILIDFGPFQIYTYGLLMALAFIAALIIGLRLAPRYGLDKALIWDWMFFVLLGAIIGARLLYLFVERHHLDWSFSNLLNLLLHAGGVFYGGFIGAFLASVLFLRRRKVSIWLAADIAAPAVALGQGIGRWGCFFAGCCWGKPTNVPWAIVFNNPVAGERMGTPLGVHLHPTQIYESLFTLLLAGVLLRLHRRPHREGDIWWLYLPAYAIGRFIIEFFRGDPRGQWLWFSTSQWIALVIVLISIWWWAGYRRRMSEVSPAIENS